MTTLEPKPIVTRPWPVRQPVTGLGVRAPAAHDGREADRHHVPGHVVHLLPGRRLHGAADAGRAGPAGPAVPVAGAVQPAVHHARHDHAAVLRDADRVRLRELHRAAADRRAGRLVPAAERVGLLALRVRWHARRRRLRHPGRCGRLRLVRLPAAGQRRSTRRASAATCGSSAWSSPASARSSAPST